MPAFFSKVSMCLTEQPPSVPLSLVGIVEANFPGYAPSLLVSVQAVRIQSGMVSMRCIGNFLNSGVIGSANPIGAYLVESAGTDNARLLAYMKLSELPAGGIPHGTFQISANFVFNEQD
jgi:hypothetical protein